jgi:hypothetical protein
MMNQLLKKQRPVGIIGSGLLLNLFPVCRFLRIEIEQVVHSSKIGRVIIEFVQPFPGGYN